MWKCAGVTVGDDNISSTCRLAFIGTPPSEISCCHFSRGFIPSTSFPLHSSVTARQIEPTKELLATSQLPMSEIALEVSFSSQAHLEPWLTASAIS